MYYMEVLVADATFHGSEPLTYVAENRLAVGSLVRVPLRAKEVLGVVVGHTNRPKFTVKPLLAYPGLPALPANLTKLHSWMADYYPAPFGILTSLFLPKQLPKQPLAVSGLPAPNMADLPVLSHDQQAALRQITPNGSHMLHGETGTGKTRVYIELAARAVRANCSAIILTPEIGLTSQLANDFRRIFGDRVIVLHSQLTEATRQRAWQYILQQPEPLIVIGARSALFSPLRNVGLIVVDESHETAYKQDQAPYYHATTVAAKLAALHRATLVLGSATPLVSDYYIAAAKQRPIIRMQQPAKPHDFPAPTIAVVDLRDRSRFTKSPYLSGPLLQALQHTLSRREQALIFLNRRGTARIILCESCGWQAVCPHCDVPLVYHGDHHRIRCHSCDYTAPAPASCPVCHHASIVFKSVGTKAIVSELDRLFPEARIMRFDTDNKKNERIEQHYQALHAGKVDILVGTQTLAKGLDLPRLSLVGVVVADTSLFFPDFSAQERTYQLLCQVLGRIGRGHVAGQAVIQTYNPDSPLLAAVLHKDWQQFYQTEITERQRFRFPPFCYLLKLSCRRASSPSAASVATKLANTLSQRFPGLTIEGPAPAFHEKVQDKYAWQLIVKSSKRTTLTQIIRELPSGWSYDIDPMNLL